MLGVIANTVLLTVGCDNKVESSRRSVGDKDLRHDFGVDGRRVLESTLRHVCISFVSRCMPRAAWRENPSGKAIEPVAQQNFPLH